MGKLTVSGAKSDRKQIAAVLINSENDYSNDPEWQKEQYLLSQKNYANFLEYDSWLDCFEIKELKVRKIAARKAEKKGHPEVDCITHFFISLRQGNFFF